jgi:hypothetical protein
MGFVTSKKTMGESVISNMDLGHAETIKYEKSGITSYVLLHAGDRLSEDMNQKTCKEVCIPFYVGLKIAYFLNPNYLMTI